MQLTTYTLKTCDTCRKALKALEAAGHDVTNIDIRADGVPPGALSGWMAALGPEVLVNTRSTTWRGLSEAERARAATAEGAAALLAEHPTLMKRPVIVAGEDVHVGWTPAVRGALGA
ncbi:ArsC family transcriptional regulator [Paroceanicella profunda]|uniref:ArsC family transcriptional regulator n=1 Tax=Paroceanicella profunda TaxID=2579971 RepID=A0A5B8FW11_9RHOB|nr:ArsC/Spx/MgsR family protein [Paroceanicella profunda]QDL91380.1 ArsC family transcriptional regulator [Paroceanicella profunda]